MDFLFSFIFPLLILTFISLLLKYLIIFLKKKKNLDIPEPRSNHSYPKPKGAGIVIIPTILISIFVYIKFGYIAFYPWFYISLLMLVLFFTSLFDDLYNLTIFPRISIQILCIILGLQIFEDNISEISKSLISEEYIIKDQFFIELILKSFLTIIWLWLVNLFNFMDGMDGLTSCQVSTFSIGMIILSILGHISSNETYIGLIMLSASIAFFIWNKPPAKLFLGDVGSIPIGFLIASIIIYNFIENNNFFPLILLILFHISDATITLLLRLFKRKNILKAHSEHFYQNKIRLGFEHGEVLKKISIVNILLVLYMLLYLKSPEIGIFLSFVTIAGVMYWLKKDKK